MKPTEKTKKNSSKVSSRLSLGEHVPKLRFPGFEGEWEERTLEKCCRCFDNKRKPISAELREKGEVPYYGANGIQDYVKDFIFNGKFLLLAEDGGHFDEYSKKPIAQYITGKSWVNNHAHVLSGKDNCLTEYIYFSLVHKDIRKYINGTSRAKLNQEDMWDIKIHVPQVKLQEKISTFLFLIEERIAAQRKLVELLKKHKRGLLDRIFERSKQTEKWKKYRLDQIAEINPSSESLPCEFFYIDLESVSDGVWHDKKVVKKESAPSRAQRVIQKNDILFQMVRPYQQNNLHITTSYDKPIVASTGYAQIRTSQNPSFIYWLLHSRTFLRKVLLRCTGSSYPAINSSDLKEIYVSIPPLEDQDQYARALNYISQKCNIEESLVCHLENLKSGLLQQIFV